MRVILSRDYTFGLSSLTSTSSEQARNCCVWARVVRYGMSPETETGVARARKP